MADDYNFSEGTGRTARAREIGGKLHHVNIFRADPDALVGAETYRNINPGVTGDVVKASPAVVTGGDFFNNHATDARFVKLYNKATAPDETDTPKRTYRVPAKGGVTFSKAIGVKFSLGLSVRVTTGVADNDTGAPGANDVIINLDWE